MSTIGLGIAIGPDQQLQDLESSRAAGWRCEDENCGGGGARFRMKFRAGAFDINPAVCCRCRETGRAAVDLPIPDEKSGYGAARLMRSVIGRGSAAR